MRHRTGTALLAALVGTTGGVVFAVMAEKPSAGPPAPHAETSTAAPVAPTSPTSSPTKSSPSPSKSYYGSGTAEDNAPLLYVADQVIHDGQEIITMDALDDLDVISVDRLNEGYLVGTTGYGDQEDAILHIVDPSGGTRKLARAFYPYDINLAKDRVVAIDSVTKRAVVYSSTGKVIGKTDKALDNAGRAAVGFVEDEVLIVTEDSQNKQKAVRWDPRTSKTKKVDAPELSSAGVSPGGSFVAGNTAGSEEEGGCLGVRSDNRVGIQHNWKACDWRSFGAQGQFSPDGSLVLAVPVLTDGFGPGELAVFGVREDSDKPVDDFKTPNLTTDAKWADNEYLWLTGARGGDYDFNEGAWIRKCDLEGRCEIVATTDKVGNVVLGGGVY